MEYDDILYAIKENPKAIQRWMPKMDAVARNCREQRKLVSSQWLEDVYNSTILNPSEFGNNPDVIPEMLRCFQRIAPFIDGYIFDSYTSTTITLLLLPAELVKECGVIPRGCDMESTYHNYMTSILHTLMDIYVPSDFVEDIIHIIFTIDDHDPIQKILKSNANLSFMKDISITIDNSGETPYYIRSVQTSVQKLILYIIDIYNNPEVAIDTCAKLIQQEYAKVNLSPLYNYADKFKEYGYEDGVRDCVEVRFLYRGFPDSYSEKIAAFFYETYRDKAYDKYFISYVSGLLTRTMEFLVKKYGMQEAEKAQLKTNFDKALGMLMDYVKGNIPYCPEEESTYDLATEASRGVTLKVSQTKNKISNAFTAFKRNEKRVDEQLSNMIMTIKNKFIGDTKVELIEGKKFSLISILKAALASAALFSYSKIGFLLAAILRIVLKNKSRRTERLKLKMELEEEIEIITEKIQDAAADGDKEAKYAMMRTKKELENALTRLKIGIEADDRSIRAAKDVITSNRSGGERKE